MNDLTLYIEEFKGQNKLIKDNITFSDVVIIRMLIDGIDIEENVRFKDSLIVLDELEKSVHSNGNYLIFTCACGIAEDGGWEGVNVTVEDGVVKWALEDDRGDMFFSFELENYETEINRVKGEVHSSGLLIPPENVIYPDGFSR